MEQKNLTEKTQSGRYPEAFLKEWIAYCDAIRPHGYQGKYLYDFNTNKAQSIVSLCSKGIFIPERFIDRIGIVKFTHSNKFPRWFMGVDNAMKILRGKKIETVFDRRKDVLFMIIINQ